MKIILPKEDASRHPLRDIEALDIFSFEGGFFLATGWVGITFSPPERIQCTSFIGVSGCDKKTLTALYIDRMDLAYRQPATFDNIDNDPTDYPIHESTLTVDQRRCSPLKS